MRGLNLAVDAVYSANTVHIMGWLEVEAFFAGVGHVVVSRVVCWCCTARFNYDGQYSSASNARFDQWLKHARSAQWDSGFRRPEPAGGTGGDGSFSTITRCR
jgi:hypothetical protein